MNTIIDKDKILAQNPKADKNIIEDAIRLFEWAKLKGIATNPNSYPVPYSQTIFNSESEKDCVST